MSSIFHISGEQDYYCVIGNPIAHSKSPIIHRMFARQTRQNLRYERVLVPEGGLSAALTEFQSAGGRGINVTLPFKEQAYRAVRRNSERARLAGAVNTLWLDAHGCWHGDNTDGIGFIRDLTGNHGCDLTAKRILICGAGGSVRGLLPAVLPAGPDEVLIANRTLSRARDIAALLDGRVPVQACRYAELPGLHFDLIINATSMGLRNEVPPLPDDSIGSGTWCYDLLYDDAPTAFQRWARARGARCTLDGLGMLVEQAAESFFLWRAVRPQTAPVIEALRRAHQ